MTDPSGHRAPRLTAREIREVAELAARIDREPRLPCDPQPVVDGLRLRRILGRTRWTVPQRHGCCGWTLDNQLGRGRVIVTGDHASQATEGVQWVHASISRPADYPTYDDLVILKQAVFGDGWAYQVFAPPSQHINIHNYALHLFGRADGEPALPDFGRHGTI